MISSGTTELIKTLQAEVLRLQKPLRSVLTSDPAVTTHPLCAAFPNKQFPGGAVHEFISYNEANAAASDAFICGLIHTFLNHSGYCLWVHQQADIYAPALASFGLKPEQIIFVSVHNDKEALWVLEESLKCPALYAVVGNICELSFNESRRLQLAVEASGVTGFIHRRQPRNEHPVACSTRWKIRPLPSMNTTGLPGPGFPKWDVQLLKIRNGRPMRWELEWTNTGFTVPPASMPLTSRTEKRQAG